ncbi:MAG: ATP-dependent Clp protease ATP-binding subunit [Christensenellales bacterium]
MDYFESFNEGVRKAMDAAQKEARELGHNYIGSEHLLLGLLSVPDGAAAKALKNAGVTKETVRQMVLRLIGQGDYQFNEHFSYTPRTKKVIELSLQEAKHLEHNYVGTEHLLLALLREKDCVAARIIEDCGVDVSQLKNALMGNIQSKDGGETPVLNQFGKDLTQAAKNKELDPVIGRTEEIERIVQILCRRTKNNPVLVGEPGVGKSAVVEGLAQRIVDGNIPELLINKRVVTLDLSGMVAGTKYRGEFEERMKNAMAELKQAGNVILFIDELHTIIGAGASEGAIDAANILKPALARGEIQVIGATTLDEYRKHFEKDAALERRFQTVLVGEPTPEQTVEILKGLRDRYEAHHKVRITNEAIESAVSLSHRYISDRFLPDKAIDLMDEAASRVRIANYVIPPEIKALEVRLASVRKEKEEAITNQTFEKAAKLRDEEREILSDMQKKKDEVNANRSNAQLVVTEDEIAQIVSSWTHIPVKKLTEDESDRLLKLEETLHERVIGQDEAVQAVARAIRRARAGLKDPKRPIGSFIFLGPTGVGKTELSRALAQAMFGDENAMIRVDMSEFMEKHSVSKLVGSPPGYVGYDEGGQLTEKIRRKPYAVVLFDEIEKAHEDVFNIMLQILEDGRLSDAKGRVVDFKNTVIIMTSNVGSRAGVQTRTMGFEASTGNMREYARMKEDMLDALKKTFRPEFLNRIDDLVVFHMLEEKHIRQIVDLMAKALVRRLKEREVDLTISDDAKDYLAKTGFDPLYGARPLRRVMQQRVEDSLSEEMLSGRVKKGDRIIAYMDGEVLKFKQNKTKNK